MFEEGIKSAKYFKEKVGDTTRYVSIEVVDKDNVKHFVPVSNDHPDYVNIKKQVDAGELTIEDAD